MSMRYRVDFIPFTETLGMTLSGQGYLEKDQRIKFSQ